MPPRRSKGQQRRTSDDFAEDSSDAFPTKGSKTKQTRKLVDLSEYSDDAAHATSRPRTSATSRDELVALVDTSLVAQYTAELADKQNDKTILQQRIDGLQARINGPQARIDALQARIDELNASIEKLNGQIDELELKDDELSKDRKKRRQRLLTKAEAEKEEVKSELKEALGDMKDLDKEIKELDKEVKEAFGDMKELNEEIKKVNEKLAQAKQNQGNASLSIESNTTEHVGYTLTTQGPALNIATKMQSYVEQIYQARRYYHDKGALPLYITDNLLALAKNDDFIQLLQSYKNNFVLTFNTQHDIKTQLAAAINSHPNILPSFSEEKDFPVFDLGRGEGKSPLANKRFRFIHPVTAMQTFAQFHHLETHFGGHLATFYPNPDDLARVLHCSALCAHFLGGFTQLPGTPNLRKLEEDAKFAHTNMSRGLKQGLKLVGPPGSGKTGLLATPVLNAALNHTNTTVTLSHGNEFAVVSLDFSKAKDFETPFTATICSFSNPEFSTACQLYVNTLHRYLHGLPKEKHLLVIDPLEQRDSSDVLGAFKVMYAYLLSSHPSLLILSAHSTPYLDPINQGKEGGQVGGNLAAYYSEFQFANMELTHDSLKKLFVPLIHKLYPPRTHPQLHSNLDQYFDLVATFNVPSIRGYLSFFLEPKQSLLSLLDARIDVRAPGESATDFSRTTVLNPKKHPELALLPWLKHSSYSHVDTDTGAPNCTTSTFLRRAIQSYYSITRRFEIDEENAICTAASILNAKWKQIDPVSNRILKQVRIARVIENSSFPPGQFASKTIKVPGDSLQVLAKYRAELNYLGQLPLESRRNTLFRVSPRFPAFDFIVFDATGTKASFISLKTGAKDAHQKFYQAAVDLYATHLQIPLSDCDWFVWVTNPLLKTNPNTMIYCVPEDIFGFSVDGVRGYLRQKIQDIASWDDTNSFFPLPN